MPMVMIGLDGGKDTNNVKFSIMNLKCKTHFTFNIFHFIFYIYNPGLTGFDSMVLCLVSMPGFVNMAR